MFQGTMKCLIVFHICITALGVYGSSLDSDRPSFERSLDDDSKQTSHMMVTVPSHLVDGTTEESVTASPSIVTTSCTAFINSFADAAAEYTKCSITHARPFRFCERCIEAYLEATDRYDLIIEGSAKDEKGARCSDVILNSDKIQLVTKTRDFIQSIWDSCNCKNCYDEYEKINSTSTAKLNNDTHKFFEYVNDTWACFQNYTQGEIIPFGPQGNYTFNKTVCTKCKDKYTTLNHYYEDLEEKYSHNTCMDMVDAMNYTRLLWSKDFTCSHKNGDLLPVLLLSGAFSLLPVVFYVSNKAFGSRRETKLVKQKRLRDLNSDASIRGSENPVTT